MTGYVVTRHLYPILYTIQILEEGHSPQGSDVPWVFELKWDEDCCFLLYAFEAMVGSQHQAESQRLCQIDGLGLGSLWVHNTRTQCNSIDADP